MSRHTPERQPTREDLETRTPHAPPRGQTIGDEKQTRTRTLTSAHKCHVHARPRTPTRTPLRLARARPRTRLCAFLSAPQSAPLRGRPGLSVSRRSPHLRPATTSGAPPPEAAVPTTTRESIIAWSSRTPYYRTPRGRRPYYRTAGLPSDERLEHGGSTHNRHCVRGPALAPDLVLPDSR